MLPKSASREGAASPLILGILGFLVISFILGSIAVVKQNFDLRERAAGLYTVGHECTSNLDCESGKCSDIIIGLTRICQAVTPSPSPSPTPAIQNRYACVNGQCVINASGEYLSISECGSLCRTTVSPFPSPACIANGQVLGQGATCCAGPGNYYQKGSSYICGPAPAGIPAPAIQTCPTTCLNGCIANTNSTFSCLAYCSPSCTNGCTFTSPTGGECKAKEPYCDNPNKCASGYVCSLTLTGGVCLQQTCTNSGWECFKKTQGDYRRLCQTTPVGLQPVSEEYCPGGCASGSCLECNANTCVNGKWCGKDGKLTTLKCQPGQNRCEDFSTGTCLPQIPTGQTCRQNLDCGYGYMCLKDPGDNTFSCQPEQKTKFCWTYNFVTLKCESFKSFAGVACPTGSSPNSDICIHQTPDTGLSGENCTSSEPQGKKQYCLGNQSISCNEKNKTVVEACPNGCILDTGLCNNDGNFCTAGLSWCNTEKANELLTCSGSYISEIALYSVVCPHGCNLATNSCYQNPADLSYNQVLKQNIEDQYNISITVEETDGSRIYNTLTQIQQVYESLPKEMTSKVQTITILFTTAAPGGYTNGNGDVNLYSCDHLYTSNGKCKRYLTHEIAHSTEKIRVTSQDCYNGCNAIEGFVAAAGNDPNPLYFKTDGSLDESTSNIAGLGSGSNQNDREYFANYQAFYFVDPQALKTAHPTIYAFFQAMYHYYQN